MKKSIIRYQASKVPVASNLNISVAQRSVSKTESTNWADKAELVSFADQLYSPPSADYLQIICQCNAEYAYATKADVPSTNVTCSCGRKLIEFGN